MNSEQIRNLVFGCIVWIVRQAKEERERERTWVGCGETTTMSRPILVPSVWRISKTQTLATAIIVRPGKLFKPNATPRRSSLVNLSKNVRKLSRFSGIASASPSLSISTHDFVIVLAPSKESVS